MATGYISVIFLEIAACADCINCRIYCLSNDKAFAHGNLISVCNRVRHNFGKGEKAEKQLFLFIPECLQDCLTLSKTSPGFYVSVVQVF